MHVWTLDEDNIGVLNYLSVKLVRQYNMLKLKKVQKQYNIHAIGFIDKELRRSTDNIVLLVYHYRLVIST